MKRVLSYGGGLDSFAMLVRALELGERPDVVCFVDVGDGTRELDGHDPGEWPSTYRHMREVVIPLCERNGIDFEWLSSERYPVRNARSLFAWLAARKQIPVAGPNRICTVIAKVERFEAWLADAFPGERVEVWVGFEAGEEARAAKDPNAGKSTQRANRFPLIEWGLCRCQCEQLVRERGYAVPRKSACVFCPYATRGDFQRLAVELPETFEKVAQLEDVKPPTKNGAKLSIKNFRTVKNPDGSKRYIPTMLRDYVRGTYRKPVEACGVCGRAQRATKATGCTYLEAA